MFNLIRADLYKMYKSSMIKVIFGITTVCAVTMTIMAYLISKGQIDPGSSGVGFLFSDINVMSILGAVIAGAFICGDFDNKTIHVAISSGCSRSSVVVSKAIAFFCAIAVILLPYAITVGIALGTGSKFNMGSVAVGFLNILSKESGVAFSATIIIKVLVVMLTLIIVYAAQLSICVPLAFILKRPVLVVAIFYGFSILCGRLAALSNNSSMFKSIFSSTPYGGNHMFLTIDSGAGDIVKAIFVSLIFIIVMLAVTYSVFRKSEIK